MNSPELISVVILSYCRFDTIYEAIDSVLMQDYPRIELVVSDDASPCFPSEDLRNYVLKRKRDNLESFILRQEENNCGTVKHLNHAFAACNGELIGGLAADDIFYDEHTLSNYKYGFDNSPNCLLVMSQAAMYDDKMVTLQGYYFAPELIDIIREPNCGIKLFNEEARFPHLPTGATMYRKRFFEELGYFDERFTIIEDVPMHLKITRENVLIHFENFISLKHRGGGISHGNSGGLKKSFLLYARDAKHIYRDCIKPYRSLLTPDTRAYSSRRDRAQTIWLDSFIASKGGFGAQMRYVLRHPLHFLLMKFIDYHNNFVKRFNIAFPIFFLIYLFLLYVPGMITGILPSIARWLEIVSRYYKPFFSLSAFSCLCVYFLSMLLIELIREPRLQYYRWSSR